jgi:hypothetical protein
MSWLIELFDDLSPQRIRLCLSVTLPICTLSVLMNLAASLSVRGIYRDVHLSVLKTRLYRLDVLISF